MGNRMRKLIISMISVLWVLNFSAPFFIKTYQPSPAIDTIFMGTVGVLAATTKPREEEEDDHENNP
jgi:hypothetical protein